MQHMLVCIVIYFLAQYHWSSGNVFQFSVNPNMKRKRDDAVAAFIDDSDESDVIETNEPTQKKPKLNELDDTLNQINDNYDYKELLKEIPFTNDELEGEYDEETFMDKLSTYLEQKYDNDSDNNTDNINNNKQISTLDILTMDENQLNKIMPVTDNEVNNYKFKYLPTFENNVNQSKRKNKKRNKNKYYKVPQLNKAMKSRKKKRKKSNK
eukprot:109063_1